MTKKKDTMKGSASEALVAQDQALMKALIQGLEGEMTLLAKHKKELLRLAAQRGLNANRSTDHVITHFAHIDRPHPRTAEFRHLFIRIRKARGVYRVCQNEPGGETHFTGRVLDALAYFPTGLS